MIRVATVITCPYCKTAGEPQPDGSCRGCGTSLKLLSLLDEVAEGYSQDGYGLLDSNRPGEAAICFLLASQIDTGKSEYTLAAARALMKSGDFSRAEKMIGEMDDLPVGDTDAHSLRGELQQARQHELARIRRRKMLGSFFSLGFILLGASLLLFGLWARNLGRPSPTTAVSQALRSNPETKGLSIRVSQQGRTVALSGTVRTELERSRVISVAAATGHSVSSSGLTVEFGAPFAVLLNNLSKAGTLPRGLTWAERNGMLYASGVVPSQLERDALAHFLQNGPYQGKFDLNGVKCAADGIALRPGDTLWSVAERLYGNGNMYLRFTDKSGHAISNPSLIHCGQVIYAPRTQDSAQQRP